MAVGPVTNSAKPSCSIVSRGTLDGRARPIRSTSGSLASRSEPDVVFRTPCEGTEAIHETLTPSRAGGGRGGRHHIVNQRPAGDQPRHGAALAQHRPVS